MASSPQEMRVFWEKHPIFTLDELSIGLSLKGGPGASNILQYHKRMGRLGRIKRGLYYVIRPGQTSLTAPVDSFLLASKIAPDAVLSYHTALDLLGLAHSSFSTYYCFSNRFQPALRFRKDQFRVIVTPRALRNNSRELIATEKVDRLGAKLVVTRKERTLVECLEKPQYCGGFEEMYRSLEKIPFIQPDVLLTYLDMREQKKLYARTGFFLEQHREGLHVEESLLKLIARNIPAQPLYLSPRRKGGALMRRWNLIVPEVVRDRRWEER